MDSFKNTGSVLVSSAITILLFSAVSYGMGPSILWSRTISGVREAGFNCLSTPDSEENFLAVGRAAGGGVGYIIVCEMSSSGEVLWEQNYFLGASACAAGVLRVDGGYVIAGTTEKGADTSGFLMRIDTSGQVVWRRWLSGSGVGRFCDICLTEDGNLLAVGCTSATPGGTRNIWMVCADPEGNTAWEAIHEDPGHQIAHAVVLLEGEGFALSGSDGSSVFLLLTDSFGTRVSKTLHDMGGVDMARGLRRLDSDGFLAWGSTVASSRMPSALFMLFDQSGQLAWNMSWTTGGVETCTQAISIPTGGYVFLCHSNSPDRVGFVSVLLRLDSRGETLWEKTIDLGRQTELRAVQATGDGGFLLAGTVEYECRSRVPIVVRLGPEEPVDR
jgi:outer membrane protein assembly factor BamB